MRLEPLTRAQRLTFQVIVDYLISRQSAWMVADSLPYAIKNRDHQCQILERKGWLTSEVRGQHPLLKRYYQPSNAYMLTSECKDCDGLGSRHITSGQRMIHSKCLRCRGVGRVYNS